mgnify:FL=1
MLLYHGSDHIIEKPEFGAGKKHNDYGRGFYCTQNIELAKEWAVSEDADGYVNKYSIYTSKLEVLDINSDKYTMMHWLGILLKNRIFTLTTPLEREAKQYILDNFNISLDGIDIVKGYRADDSYFSYARDFISGVISYEQLSKAMRLGKLGEQYCLISKKAFAALEYTGSEYANFKEWYPRKMLRDMYARKGYRDMEKESYRRGELYISRIIDEEMKKGDLFVITGMSGAELAIRVLDIPDDDIIMPSYNTAKSQEYWTGWILAYYQWENGKTFEMIDKEIPICKIRNMYNPYHEMDISSAILKLREMSQVSRAETYLKKLRKRAGISQSILAEETGIPVKTIQQYEQRRKDINKAQVEYVVRLSKALCCEPQDILEEK